MVAACGLFARLSGIVDRRLDNYIVCAHEVYLQVGGKLSQSVHNSINIKKMSI